VGISQPRSGRAERNRRHSRRRRTRSAGPCQSEPGLEREIAYGIPGPHPKPFAQEELDHLIPLELGGAPEAIKNLWPEPRDGRLGYKRKDTLENRLKRLVCAHSLSLKLAQKAIASNWVAAYRKYVGAIP
jgi:hypothetical protein